MEIDIQSYWYPLADEQVAKYPVSPRDESKLLFYNKGKIEHLRFKEIDACLSENTHLVLNNTRVIPARLFFQRATGATIEVFLLRAVEPSEVIPVVMSQTETVVWECVVGNKKKWKEEEVLYAPFSFNGKEFQLKAQWSDITLNQVRLEWGGGARFSELVEIFGYMPLPPYLHRQTEESDKVNYQTIYSEKKGAVAAPTAGLHFTDKVFSSLDDKGVEKSFLTLHVGAGTFMPVKEKNALDHPMHSEQMIITQTILKRLIENSSFVVPVGTTSMRFLESLYWLGVKMIKKDSNLKLIEKLYPYQNQTDINIVDSLGAVLSFMIGEELEILPLNTEIMIFPSYQFKICKGIITNFHQPSSTLLLLVAALIGDDEWKRVYSEAADNGYRFLSYGDSSLLIP